MAKYPKFQDVQFDVDPTENEVTAHAWGLSGKADIPPRAAGVDVAKSDAYHDLLVNIGIHKGRGDLVFVGLDRGEHSSSVVDRPIFGIDIHRGGHFADALAYTIHSIKPGQFKENLMRPVQYRSKLTTFTARAWYWDEAPHPSVENHQIHRCFHCLHHGRLHGRIKDSNQIVCPGDLICEMPAGGVIALPSEVVRLIATLIPEPMRQGWYWCETEKGKPAVPMYWHEKSQLFYPYSGHDIVDPEEGTKFHNIHKIGAHINPSGL